MSKIINKQVEGISKWSGHSSHSVSPAEVKLSSTYASAKEVICLHQESWAKFTFLTQEIKLNISMTFSDLATKKICYPSNVMSSLILF